MEEFELRIEVLQDGKPIGVQPIKLQLEAASPKHAVTLALEALESAIRQFVHVVPEPPAEATSEADEESIAAEKCAEVHEDERAQFLILADRARAKGYNLILGLLEDESVYQVAALCKHPDCWSPYKAHRYFEEADAVALWWFYDGALSSQNAAGNLIYAESDEEGAPAVNTEAWSRLDPEEASETFARLDAEDRQEVMRRMREAASGSITERWDAPRSG